MAKQIKEEYKIFMKDIEKNFKNKEDLEYLKTRIPRLMDKVLNELSNIEFKLNDREEVIKEIKENQQSMESKVNKILRKVNSIESDIYDYNDETAYDYEIVCPYCSNSFLIEADETKTEVKCPKCKNEIELDWSSSPEYDWDINYTYGDDNDNGHHQIDIDDDM